VQVAAKNRPADVNVLKRVLFIVKDVIGVVLLSKWQMNVNTVLIRSASNHEQTDD
jgi:hypothetical protein